MKRKRLKTARQPQRFINILLLLLAVFFLIACADKPNAESEVNQSSKTQNLSNLIACLPRAGWNLFDEVRTFTAVNLYEQINGRAELYLAYEVTSLTIATFENPSDIGEFIELSVFDMGTATNAFGIFSVERPQNEPALNLGRKSYSSGSSLFIWKGQYYITVVISESGEQSQQLGLNMARKVTDFLSDSGEPVWGLSALPQKNRVPDSVLYFKVDALGLDFLRDTYTVKYRKDGIEISAFLSQQKSSDSARETVAKYAEYASQYGKGSRSQTKESTTYILCEINNGFDVIFQKGRLVGGIVSVQDPSTALAAAAEFRDQIGAK